MDLCLLCLEFKHELSEGIKVTSSQWKEEQMEALIEKHFWPLKFITSMSWLCHACWETVNDFHKFYIRIENAHRYCVKTELLDTDEGVDSVVPNNSSPLYKNSQEDKYNKELNISPDEEDITLIIKTELHELLIPDAVEVPLKTRQKRSDPLEKPLPAESCKDHKLVKCIKQEEISESKIDAVDDHQSIALNPTSSPIDFEANYRSSSDSHNESDSGETSTDKPRSKSCYKTRANRTKLDDFLAKNFNITCAICQAPMKSFPELCNHFVKHHNERAYVICCNKKFVKRNILVDHIRCHLNPEHFKCNSCGKILSNRRCLKMHAKTHETKDKPHICDICERGFAHRSGLWKHKLIHLSDEEKKFPCDQCGKLFGNNNMLSNHVRTVHLNNYALICDICGKKMSKKDVFERHMLQHNGVVLPTISCDVCGLKVTDQQGLKRHKDTQHPEGGKKEFPCQLCTVISPTLKAHRKHVQYKHEMGYNFKCTICGKAFKRSTSLTEHMATHTGTILYTCSYCPKTFKSNANMHSHRKKAHPKEWEQALRAKYSGNLPPTYKPAVSNDEQNSDAEKWQ